MMPLFTQTRYLEALLQHRLQPTSHDENQLVYWRDLALQLIGADGMMVMVTNPGLNAFHSLPGSDHHPVLIEWLNEYLSQLAQDERLQMLVKTAHLGSKAPAPLHQEATCLHAKSYLRLPIIVQDQLRGLVAFYSYQADQFSDEHIGLARLFAELFAIHLENIILHEHYTRSETYQQAAYKMSVLINNDLGLREVLGEVVQEAMRLTRASTALVMLVDENNVLEMAAQAGDLSLLAHDPAPIQAEDNLFEQITRQARPIIIREHEPYEETLEQIFDVERTNSLLGVPLVCQETTLGVLVVARSHRDGDERLSVNELEILELLAPLASTAIEKAQLRDAVRQERMQLQALLDHVRAPILVFNRDGLLEMANPEAHNVGRRIGISVYTLIGQPVAHIARLLPSSTKLPPSFVINQPMDIHLGEGGEFIIRIAEVPDDRGLIRNYVIVAQEVTKERELDRAKSELLYVLSHDLGNILTLGLGYASLAVEENLDATEYLFTTRKVYDSLIRARALIRDVVALEQIYVSNQSALILQPYNLNEILNEIYEVHRDTALNKSQRFVVENHARAPDLKGNSALIKQALENLVTNAIKYTPEGGQVTVRLHIRPEYILIDVEDTGLGMPAESLTRIWERYYRIDEHRRMNIPGTGLGLPLVKSVIESHGGQITVKSAVGQGSLFQVKLPINFGEEPPHPV